MSAKSPSEEHSNDKNTSSDQQYKTWDIVKATQVRILSC